MLRNTYRKVRYADDGLSEFQCLECYSKFYWYPHSDINFCPLCGTKFTQMMIFKEKEYIPYKEPLILWKIEYRYDSSSFNIKKEYSTKYKSVEILKLARSYSSEYGPIKIHCGGLFIEIDERAKEFAKWHPIAEAIGFKKDPQSCIGSWIRSSQYGVVDWECFDHYGKFRDFLMEDGTPEEIKIHNNMLPGNLILKVFCL